jgi:hypothetical protein
MEFPTELTEDEAKKLSQNIVRIVTTTAAGGAAMFGLQQNNASTTSRELAASLAPSAMSVIIADPITDNTYAEIVETVRPMLHSNTESVVGRSSLSSSSSSSSISCSSSLWDVLLIPLAKRLLRVGIGATPSSLDHPKIPSNQTSLWTINDDKIMAIKEAHKLKAVIEGNSSIANKDETVDVDVEPSVPYISTNDILASWFLSQNRDAVIGCLLADLRGRDPEIPSNMAGNYQAEIVYNTRSSSNNNNNNKAHKSKDNLTPAWIRASVQRKEELLKRHGDRDLRGTLALSGGFLSRGFPEFLPYQTGRISARHCRWNMRDVSSSNRNVTSPSYCSTRACTIRSDGTAWRSFGTRRTNSGPRHGAAVCYRGREPSPGQAGALFVVA